MLLLLLACSTPTPKEVEKPKAELPLYQQLYAGETGPESRARGDRLRILLWLKALELQEEQRRSLVTAAQAMQVEQASLKAEEEARDAAEMAALAPLYADLSQQALSKTPDPGELAEFNRKIGEARQKLGSFQGVRLRHLRAMLALAERWLDGLEPEQKLAFQHALFFLRLPASPQLAPVYYNALVGTAWPAESFASLRRVTPDAEEEPGSLNIGGLWTLDQGATDASASMEGLQQQVLTVLALGHPQLLPALQVLQNQRAPEDFSEEPGSP